MAEYKTGTCPLLALNGPLPVSWVQSTGSGVSLSRRWRHEFDAAAFWRRLFRCLECCPPTGWRRSQRAHPPIVDEHACDLPDMDLGLQDRRGMTLPCDGPLCTALATAATRRRLACDGSRRNSRLATPRLRRCNDADVDEGTGRAHDRTMLATCRDAAAEAQRSHG